MTAADTHSPTLPYPERGGAVGKHVRVSPDLRVVALLLEAGDSTFGQWLFDEHRVLDLQFLEFGGTLQFIARRLLFDFMPIHGGFHVVMAVGIRSCFGSGFRKGFEDSSCRHETTTFGLLSHAA